jgi:lipopolysaccharide assembly outer membrane protein LptD (OstA)
MKKMRLLAIESAFLLTCLGISCSCQQQEQIQKPGSMTITMSSTAKASGFYSPSESPPIASEVCAENVAIETDMLTCTADTGMFNRETGQLVLTGNVVIRTADGIEFTAEDVVLKTCSAAEKSL